MDHLISPEYASDPTTGGILPRYLDLIGVCRKLLILRFSERVRDMLAEMDDVLLSLAENAETNAVRSHYYEVMHEILLKQGKIQQVFAAEMERGFRNFEAGIVAPLRAPVSQIVDKLSLIEKDEYEVGLAYREASRRANEAYLEQLLALDHRLAAMTGGNPVGESHPGLPGCPAQVCDAMQTALLALDFPMEVRIRVAIAHEFERRVLRKAAKFYDEFNLELRQAGVLPNLSLEEIGYKPRGKASIDILSRRSKPESKEAIAVPDDERSDSGVAFELFQGIQQLLEMRRETSGGGTVGGASATDMPGLMSSLNTLQTSIPPIAQLQFGQVSMDSVKEGFTRHLAQLSEMLQQQQIATPDAGVIDLVGMLFEFVLNDVNLPDSVKALLSHLHTPFLKVAILDRKFFFRNKHPARRLLNALTQAGAMCSDSNTEGPGIFMKMRSIVARVVDEFESEPKVFETTLEEFEDFMAGFSRRSTSVEKRSVENAKGRERLREARQAVSQEIVDRTWDRPIPKEAENLIMGAWANLMVLAYLRSGKDSDEWREALSVVDQIIWSVQPKDSLAEQQALRATLPNLEKAVRNGLAMIGDSEVSIQALLDELGAYHEQLLSQKVTAEAILPPPSPVTFISGQVGHRAPPAIQMDKALWDDIEIPEAAEALLVEEESGDTLNIAAQLKMIRLGTWFEFTDSRTQARQRAKLSWYSPKTAYYIFVDQHGVQVAVKSLRILCQEMAGGSARILPQVKKPYVDHALENVYSLLKQPDGDLSLTS